MPVVYDYRRRKGHKWAWAVLALLLLGAGWYLLSHPGLIPRLNVSPGYDSIEDITKNPERYVGREVRVRGVLNYAIPGCAPSEDVMWGVYDSQGYYVYVIPPEEQRVFIRGDEYEIVGVLRRIYCSKLVIKGNTATMVKQPLYVIEAKEARRV